MTRTLSLRGARYPITSIIIEISVIINYLILINYYTFIVPKGHPELSLDFLKLWNEPLIFEENIHTNFLDDQFRARTINIYYIVGQFMSLIKLKT